MEYYLSIALLMLAGVAAGFINVMAGGGSTITLPILIFLGLDGATANGTNRIAILIQNVAGVLSFKQEKYSEFGKSMKMAIWTLPGAIAGALFATKISNEAFNIILGIIMLGLVISMLIPKKKKISELTERELSFKSSLMMLGIGFYGGFIQVGVGIILMSVLHYYLHLKLAKVNMHKVFIVLIYTIPAILIFMLSNNVDYLLGLALAAGNATGAWLAAKISVRKGDKAVKFILIIAVFLMSFKLFGIF